MSEYQYYEFLALDKPLTKSEQKALRAVSTRAEITAAGFTNTYNWSGLKVRPESLLLKYFDAFVYAANWGTRRFAVRLPAGVVDFEALARCGGGGVVVEQHGDHVLLDFQADETESDEWISGEGWMGALTPVRTEILEGDLRGPYLGWLLAVQQGQVEDPVVSPPVPPGLRNLSSALLSLVEFLDLDPDLVAAAAAWSIGGVEDSFSEEDFRAWVLDLPLSEKDALLARIAEGDGRHTRAELLKRFREERRPRPSAAHGDAANRPLPTAGELLDRWRHAAAERERIEAERRRAEEEERERQALAKRKQYLADLATRGEAAWDDVERLIGMKQAVHYDAAVRILKDLHDLSVSQGEEAAFLARAADVRQRHGRKPSFVQRLDDAGILLADPAPGRDGLPGAGIPPCPKPSA